MSFAHPDEPDEVPRNSSLSKTVGVCISIVVFAAMVGCVWVSGQGTYKRVDRVDQNGTSNRINRTDVTIKP